VTRSASPFRRSVIVILVVGVTILFFAMLRPFLVTILMAAIFAGLAHPLFRRINELFRGRRGLAAGAVLVLFMIIVVVPLVFVLGLVAREAVEISVSVRPWVSDRFATRDRLDDILHSLPWYETIRPYRSHVLAKGAEIVGNAGSYLFERITIGTRNTVTFLIHFFLFMYTMYYLLKDGRAMLGSIREVLPLSDEDQNRILGKFTSVTRATLRGTLFIAIIQGTLAGMAFAVVGIAGAFFWGMVMTLFSVIPGLGTAIVWVPATIILFALDHVPQAIGLALFCGLVVGTIDNVLRPRLVGSETRLHPLLIFFSTIGGLALFGVGGVIIGPILAALFKTVWSMFGVAFRDPIARSRRIGFTEADE
jgi:predicted PurR-regulated permease PerM